MRTNAIRTGLAIVAAATMLVALAPAAQADAVDDVIAADTSAVAADVALPAAGRIAAASMTALASAPRTIVVTNHGIRPVSLYAKGERRRAINPRSAGPVRFTGLTAGRTYVVIVGGAELGRLVAVDRPSAAAGLTVRATAEAGSVALTWRHRASVPTGGADVWFDVSATSPGRPTVRTRAVGTRSARLVGLDRTALYVFSVVPRNSAGAGAASKARMTRTLSALRPDTDAPAPGPTAPAATSAPTPTLTATPEPASPPPPLAPGPTAPSTRTIYVCPTGSTETSSHACVVTKAYTLSTKPYTFHEEITAPSVVVAEYATTVRACPGGYNLEDYGWVMYCRRYSAPTKKQVKDPAPAGYTDDGAAWVKRDAAPAGFIDDGTQWVKTVPKVAQIVPA
jgi:hypothetical protein